MLAAGTAIAALIVAPALDRDAPWWDYETWALSTAASHSTSVLLGPRLRPARLAARRPRDAAREGASSPPTGRPRASTSSTASAGARRARARARRSINELPADPAVRDRWTQRIKVNVRNLRTRTFVTAGIAVDAPKMPHRAAIPNGPPGIWSSSRTLRRGDTYTVDVYTPKPTERELAAAGSRLRPRLRRPSARSSSTTGPPARRRHGTPRPDARAASRSGTSDAAPIAGRAPRPRDRRRSSTSTASGRSSDSDLRRTWALSQRLKRGARQPVRVRQVGRGLPRPRLHLHRVAAGRRAHARGLPVRRQVGLLPAVLGRDGAAAADGRHPRARGDRLHARARSTARPRSTSCATSTRTPGSRRGSPTSAGSRSTRRPSAAPPRSQSRRARHRRRSATRPTSAAAARSTRAPAPPRPRARRWELDRRPAASLGAAAARRRRARLPRAAAAAPAPLPELERALRRTRRAPGPGRDAAGARGRRSPARPPRRATCAPCATSATAAAAASRRAPSAAGCAPSWAAAAA